ncbi:MAG: hypothetical protein CSB32_02130 [Desulfobacterales bacterium]|nr:MAG: hypothetical protein CSB32_02130 [Desulfobacterales bacterium]
MESRLILGRQFSASLLNQTAVTLFQMAVASIEYKRRLFPEKAFYSPLLKKPVNICPFICTRLRLDFSCG